MPGIMRAAPLASARAHVPQALEERLRWNDLLRQPSPGLFYLALGQSPDQRCRADRCPASLTTADQRSPDPTARPLDLHDKSIPVASLVPVLQPSAEPLDSLLRARTPSQNRCHP